MSENNVHFAWIFAVSVAESFKEVRLFLLGSKQCMSLKGGGQLSVLFDGAAEVLLDQSILNPFRRVELRRHDMPLAFAVQLAVRFNVQHGGN
jgi:hypothetical protein